MNENMINKELGGGELIISEGSEWILLSRNVGRGGGRIVVIL